MLARAWSIRAAQRAEDQDAVVPETERRADRQLGVGFVLVLRRPFERHAGRLERGERVLADRVAVADPQVDRDAEGRCVARATVGRDDDPDRAVPAGPGAIEVRRGSARRRRRG